MSSVVSSSMYQPAPALVQPGVMDQRCVSKSLSEDTGNDNSFRAMSGQASSSGSDEFMDSGIEAKQDDSAHASGSGTSDQPIDLTTPGMAPKKLEREDPSGTLTPDSVVDDKPESLLNEPDVLEPREKQKAMVDAIMGNQISSEEMSPKPQDTPIPSSLLGGSNKRSQLPSEPEENAALDNDTATSAAAAAIINATINSIRSSGSKRKSEHPTKHDYVQEHEPIAPKMARTDPEMILPESTTINARQFIRVATSSLKEHVSTTTVRLIDDVMNQIEAYFCVAPQSAPPGSKLSKGCQTEMPFSSQSQIQLQSLAATYSDLLAAASSANSANATAGQPNQSRNAPSPPALLSSMAQFGNVSSLYSPVSPPQQQAALAALAASANNSGSRANNGSHSLSSVAAAAAGLLPTPVPSGFGSSSTGSYQYNPYLANVFQSAATALFQQQQKQQHLNGVPNCSSATNLFGANALSNLSTNAANNTAKKFNVANPLLGHTSGISHADRSRPQVASPTPSFSQLPLPNNQSSTSALDFSSVANFMAAAAKRKRTKVTDTRLSARTARKLLDNSFQGGVLDGDDRLVGIDGSGLDRCGDDARASIRNSNGTPGECVEDGLLKTSDEDFENDERILMNETGCGDQEDQDEGINRSGDSPPLTGHAGGASSTSSRVSVGAGDFDEETVDTMTRQQSANQISSSLMLPFTPSRGHQSHHHQQQIDPNFLNEHSAVLQQSAITLAGTTFPLGKTSTLTSMHLRKAKLMFFYVRYPSSSVLKIYFPDVSFNKNNTAQLVKWFSNFREFYYINIEKYSRQLVAEGVTNCDEVDVTRNSELFKVLNLHYNRNNQLQVPPGFVNAVRTTVREFMRAILLQKDQDPSWKKQIYKVIARLDEPLPAFFRSMEWMHQLLAD